MTAIATADEHRIAEAHSSRSRTASSPEPPNDAD